MLRTYVEFHQRLAALKARFAAEDGTTVPEYMLVLGFISLVVVVGFSSSGVGAAINAMGADLSSKINP